MNDPKISPWTPVAPRPSFADSKGGWFSAILLAVLAILPLRAFAQLYTETTTLHGDPGSSEYFGSWVAASGDTVVVSTSSNQRIYVFARDASGWTLQQKLTVPYSQYSYGRIAVDGDTLVAGGMVYARSGSNWALQQDLSSPDPRAALQGDTLALGNAYEGTPVDGTSRGSVAIYSRSGSSWTQQAQLLPDGTNEGMGAAIALDGNTLLAGISNGTGGAYVFVRNGATWTRQARLVLPTGNAWMGVALQGDTAAVSDPGNNCIYVFTRSGTAWTLAQTVAAPAGGGSYFGNEIALSGDILAATAQGWFHLYARTAQGWVLAQSIRRDGYDYNHVALANAGKLFVPSDMFSNSQYFASGTAEVFAVPPPPAPGSGWRDIDVGAVGLAGGSTISGAAGEVRGSGADIWETADQFHFRSETLTGDGAIIARVESAGTTNPWAKVGLMFREDVAPSARTVMALVTPGARLGLQARGATADTTRFVDAGWLGAPIWLMLSRTGNVFDAFRSADGSNWTPIGSATVSMPPTIHVGLAVSSHDNTALNTGTFSGIELMGSDPPPAPPPSDTLAGSDLGSVAVAGTFTAASGSLAIDAAGADLWDQADSGYFIHREITGDFDLRARVASLTNTHAWAKAGVMVRESLDAGSRNLFTMISADAASGLQVRDTAGAATTFSSGPWVHAPFWVRAVRTGNSFQAFVSEDGTTWQSVGTQTLALPATLHAGVAVSSHVANTTTHVTVDSLQFGN